MIPILASQRIDVFPPHGERRDNLDRRWTEFGAACGLLLVPVPNEPAAARALAGALRPRGVLLTGGANIASHGGDSPERDATEDALVQLAGHAGLPVLGVCRGMQFLLSRMGAELSAMEGHVGASHPITCAGRRMEVNSYHRLGVRPPLPIGLVPLAVADDGSIEAFRHAASPVGGIMWHPERESPPLARDVALVRRFFQTGALEIEP